MKNIHVLSTEKPSRLFKIANVFVFDVYGIKYTERYKQLHNYINHNIYITSDEEIKEGDWCLCGYISLLKVIKEITYDSVKTANKDFETKKIILTTDQDLIKDGVQAIDDEFLEWFVNNPSCDEVEVESKVIKDGVWTDLKGYVELPTTHSIIHKIIIPKEEPTIEEEYLKDELKKYDGIDVVVLNKPEEHKQETLEEAKKYLSNNGYGKGSNFTLNDVANLMIEWQQENSNINALNFEIDALKKQIELLKYQQERMYSEEEVLIIITELKSFLSFGDEFNEIEWFKKIKNK